MSTMQQLPADHPLMKLWVEFKRTQEYLNSRRWARYEEHVDGSLWAVFHAGFAAAQPAQPVAVPDDERDAEAELNCAEEVLDGYAAHLPMTETAFDCIGDYIKAVIEAQAAMLAAAPSAPKREPKEVEELKAKLAEKEEKLNVLAAALLEAFRIIAKYDPAGARAWLKKQLKKDGN